MRRAVLKEAAKRFPWLANVTLYGCFFAGGDLVHQLIAQKESIDWRHTRNVAIVATSFHGNFNYFWLRALERRFPGKSVGMVSPQTAAGPKLRVTFGHQCLLHRWDCDNLTSDVFMSRFQGTFPIPWLTMVNYLYSSLQLWQHNLRRINCKANCPTGHPHSERCVKKGRNLKMYFTGFTVSEVMQIYLHQTSFRQTWGS